MSPKRYGSALLRVLGEGRKMMPQMVANVLPKASWFLQWQMDINPKSPWYRLQFVGEHGGYFVPNDQSLRAVTDLDAADTVRRDMLILLLRSVTERKVAGDIAEVGVYKGATARLFHHYAPERVMHLFDTFEGFAARDIATEKLRNDFEVDPTYFQDTALEVATRTIAAQNNNVRFYQGYFPATADAVPTGTKFAFVHLDADLYGSTLAGLNYFYDRVVPGGIIVVHDYNGWLGARAAVDEFFADKQEVLVPMPDKSGSAVVLKR